jgi:hypothetical protein
MGRKTASKKKGSARDESGDNGADDNFPFSNDVLTSRLADRLLSTNTCDSSEEAASISAAIVEGCFADATPGTKKEDSVSPMVTLLTEYFEQLSSETAEEMARSVLGVKEVQGEDQSSDDANEDYDDERPGSAIDFSDDEDGDGEYIGEGECELCEREIRLTRHHLIPKTTWSKFKKKIPQAVEAMTCGQEDKARMILGGTLADDLPSEIVENPNNAILLRRFLSKTCNICRPCHSTVHKLHNEMELAEKYYTIDKLLEDQELLKFCKWASKQKCGKYSLNHR